MAAGANVFAKKSLHNDQFSFGYHAALNDFAAAIAVISPADIVASVPQGEPVPMGPVGATYGLVPQGKDEIYDEQGVCLAHGIFSCGMCREHKTSVPQGEPTNWPHDWPLEHTHTHICAECGTQYKGWRESRVCYACSHAAPPAQPVVSQGEHNGGDYDMRKPAQPSAEEALEECPRCYGHGPEADCGLCRGSGYATKQGERHE